MKFGEIALDEAEGAFLAHSLKANGRTFKKGRQLTGEDLEALRADHIERVVAARLGPDDVHEDEAAARVAAAVSGPNLRIDRPFTGRLPSVQDRGGRAS